MKTLIVIDVQNDFLPGGPLEVPGGDKIIPFINKIMPDFELVVATQDWHPAGHMSFASAHPEKKIFEKIRLEDMEQILWPDHCVQKSSGAEFPVSLQAERFETIFRKGTDPQIDSYSGFFDNGHRKSTGLTGYLKEKALKELYFCGLAGDICVFYSIMDAVKGGFKCHLLEEATAPLDKHQYEMCKEVLRQNEVSIIEKY